LLTDLCKELIVIEHPYQRSAPLQVVMLLTFIMTIFFLKFDGWDGAHLAAAMSFAWFLVSFTLFMVAWLLHGHASWQNSHDRVGQAD
jgi:hypothetical protein